MIEVRKNKELEISVDYNPELVYVAVFNNEDFIRSITVKNPGSKPLNNLTLKVEGFYFQTLSFEIASLAGKSSTKIDGRKILPSIEKLLLLAEPVFTEISISVSSQVREIFQFKLPVNIQAWNFWDFSDRRRSDIASFVMPNHDYVMELLAKASKILKTWNPSNTLNGYGAGSFEKFFEQLSAVWKAVTSENLKYLTQLFNYDETGQKVLTPDMIKKYRQGNCMDLTLLLCSCLERLNLSPLLVFVPGHVLAGVWLSNAYVLSDAISEDNKFLSKSILDRKKATMLVFETTRLRYENSTLEEAYEAGIELLKKQKIDYVVDIEASRNAGIKPLPFAFSPIDLIENTDNEIAGFKSLSSGSTRLEGWERKLLDISLRNPMLNLKKGKTLIKLSESDILKVVQHLKSNTITEIVECTEKEKDDKLKEIYRAARMAIEESGANNLFVSLGALEWFDVDKKIPHCAPIIFVPASIVRKKAMLYEVRLRDDEAIVNVALVEMMRQMFGINFPEFDPLPMDEMGIPSWQPIFEAFEEHLKQINIKQPEDCQWCIKNDSYLGLFSFTKFLMWNDIHSHPATVMNNKVVRGLIENIYKPEIEYDDNLDARFEFSEDLMLPVDYDYSQLKAVAASHNGISFILYGPPGTGKSQTITNMIADSLYQGKRVLFVAEKKAALDVVQTRLEKIGLAPFCLELHSNKTDKKSFFNQINNSYISLIGKGGISSEPQDSYHDGQSALFNITKELNDLMKSIHGSLKQGVSIYDSICEFLKREYEGIDYEYSEIEHLSDKELKELYSEVVSLDIVSQLLGLHPAESLLSGLYPKENTIENQNAISATLLKLPQSVDKARKKAKGIINRLFMRKSAQEILMSQRDWKQLERLADVSSVYSSDIDSIEDNIQRWISALKDLRQWYYFSDKVNKLSAYNIPKILEHFLSRHTGKESAEAVKAGYYMGLINHNLDNQANLRSFHGKLHENKLNDYQESVKDFQELRRSHLVEALKGRLQDKVLNNEEQQQLAVLMRRTLSNGRGVALRKVIHDSKNILQTVFPCMLMSPLSVAQYLEMDSETFDIVIFDEASQMETADAIGVISRGRNIVVAGDPKQLPPTRFFTSQTTAGVEIEESEDADSILEDCITLGLPSIFLSRHYRSRHESLISFSNMHFYENKLLTFPSVNDNERKVTLIDPHGVYDIGKTRTNRIEAEAVVRHTLKIANDNSIMPSIGIVALSKAQSDLIEDIFNEKLQKNKSLQQKFDECKEPIFIKNLENVQGDERDIIIFSIGYGPDKDGNISLNFGPINQNGGERRLNVAVSRAREEMVVFTSMKPYHLPQAGMSKGVKALRNFIAYATTSLHPEEDQAESLKDDAVEQITVKLRERGLDARAKIGRSDYKIDIAIVDEENPDRYKLGIIIDSRNYANLPTMRDREVVIPSVLQNLGWKLHRIWIVDWVKNPEVVIEDLLNVMQTL